MKPYLRSLLMHPATFVWLGLVIATGISWKMGTRVAADGDYRFITALLFVVALLKVRFVIRHFMEVGHAGRVLKGLTDAWAVLVLCAILGLYWQGL